MQKILVLTAAILSLAAAALGFLNRNRLIEAKSQASSVKEQLDSTSKRADKTAADLKAANEKLSALSADSDKNTADLAQAKDERDKAVAAQADLQKQVADKDTVIAQQKTDMAAKDQRIADLESKAAQTTQPAAAATDDLKKQVEEKDLLNTSLQTKQKELETQLAALKERDAQRKTMTMKPGLTGRVLAVNSSWNFVVLSLGDRNGVVNGAEMLVYRGNQLLGKVRITSVEPSTSIADIVANSVRNGFSIQPGDSVIYPNPAANSDSPAVP